MSEMKRVAIVGAGFGGLYVFRALRPHIAKNRLSVTIVNPENYFLFTPMLHEVATGGVSAWNVTEPIRKVLRSPSASFIQSSVERVLFGERRLETPAGPVPYDVLVLAPGSETEFFGVPGAERHAFQLKSLSHAIALKHRFIELFERAAGTADASERRRALAFAVVGGGPTGVELAAEMSDFLYDALGGYYADIGLAEDIRITLIDRRPELLSNFSQPMRRKALETLRRKRVEVRLDTAVKEVRPDAVVLGSGEIIPAATTVWVAGVRPRAVPGDMVLPTDDVGRILTDEFLRVKGRKDVYVLGDAGRAEIDGVPLPAQAQVATKQAATVADNIVRGTEGRPPRPFAYRHAGNLVSLGKWMAVAEISGFHFWGHFAWWMWRTIYLSKFISFNKKIKVAVDWTIYLFTRRDISRIE